jgi:hypothetical protein
MKRSALLAFVPLLGVTPPSITVLANPGVILEIETTERGSDQAMTTTIAIEGTNLRMSVQGGGPDQTGEMIFRGDRREMTVLDHQRRTFMVMDEETVRSLGTQMAAAMEQMQEALANVPAAQREMMEQMLRERMPAASAPPPMPEVRRTNERADHGGFATVKHEVLVNGRLTQELWVTDWDNVEGHEEARPAFEAMADFSKELLEALADGPMGNLANLNENGYEYMKDLDGFPVLTRNLGENGAVESESVLRSSRRETFEAAHFEPPAGYTEQTMPR